MQQIFRQVCFEKKKKTAYALLVFSSLLCCYYMQIYLLNTCKLDEENLFDFYVESMVFSINTY